MLSYLWGGNKKKDF
jgi:hypothetical protein